MIKNLEVCYNEIGLSHRLKGDELSAAETYKKLIREPVNIDLDNYKAVTQAHFYLWQFEKKQQNMDLSEDYFNKGIATLEYVIKSFPTVRSAEWASLTIGTYVLMRGNIQEAEKRAIIWPSKEISKAKDIFSLGYLMSMREN